MTIKYITPALAPVCSDGTMIPGWTGYFSPLFLPNTMTSIKVMDVSVEILFHSCAFNQCLNIV